MTKVKIWQNKYSALFRKYKEDIIYWNERDKQNQQTRFELMMELKRERERYDRLNADFQDLLNK